MIEALAWALRLVTGSGARVRPRPVGPARERKGKAVRRRLVVHRTEGGSNESSDLYYELAELPPVMLVGHNN